MTQPGTSPSTSTTSHTREQLLRMLKRDPTSVPRAEIKAAFQDGRLGDEDLDIPTLAGMKRISELLDDLEPAPPDPTPGSAKARRRATGRRNTDAPLDTSPPPRPLSEVDHALAVMAARVESLERWSASARSTSSRCGASSTRWVPAGRCGVCGWASWWPCCSRWPRSWSRSLADPAAARQRGSRRSRATSSSHGALPLDGRAVAVAGQDGEVRSRASRGG